MLKLILLSTLQSLLLVSSQIFLKFATMKMGKFEWSTFFFKDLLTNWHFALSGVSIVCATLLWLYILKHFEFSMAYPMISLSYVFGAFAAIYFFGEQIPTTRWIGIALIIIAVVLIAKK